MPPGRCYEFGCLRLETGTQTLFRDGERVALTPKAIDLLIVLVEAQGHPVGKDELLQKVWPATVVDEGSLTSHISLLRKALGEDQRHFIETIPKRGYRFLAQAREVDLPAASSARRAMLAVLPFENLSSRQRFDYFSDGLTEEMIAQLSRLNPDRLGVIARTSSMMFKGTRKRIAEIGGELGVHYVLEGTIRRSRGRIRIAAQLIQVADETHVWAENYDRRTGDVLRLQSDVAAAIAREIQIKLTPRASRRLTTMQEVPANAYEAYLKGRHLFNRRTETGMRESIAHFELAIRHYPTYAPAYAGIADAYVMLACRGMVPSKETFRRARSAARRALELDSDLCTTGTASI